MPVRVHCPHCTTPCLVAEQHLGIPVQCHRCKEAFTARASPAAAPRPTDPALVAAGPCRLAIGSASSRGRVRDRNEDSLFVQQLSWISLDQRRDLALIVLADGMGGYQGGDQASCLVIRTVGSVLAPLLSGPPGGKSPDASNKDLADSIERAIREANRAVYHQAQSDPACKGMGATAAVVLVRDGQALIGHVGDCRVYHQRGNRLTQVTRDQTLVARMVELGQLSPREALVHPGRNEVTQAIGKRLDIAPARYQVDLARGDWLVVACDGLHAHVDDRALQDAVNSSAAAAAPLADRLVELADRGGGSDNCTVVSVYCY